MEVNEALLLKSLQTHLLVHCIQSDEPPDEFLRLADRHRHRWATVVFQPSIFHGKKVASYLSEPAPRLQSLIISEVTGYMSDPLPNIRLLGGRTHNIRHLDIGATQIEWLPNAFIGLKGLILTSIWFEHLTVQYFLDVLAASPTLEFLELIDIKILPTPIEARSPPLHLTLLRSLCLSSVSTIAAECILRRITFDPHVINIIDIRLPHEEPESDQIRFLRETLPLYSPVYRQLNARCGPGYLQVDSVGSFIWKAKNNRGWSLAFGAPEIVFSDSLAWIEQVVGVNSPGVFVRLHPRFFNAIPDQVVPVLKVSRIVTGMEVNLKPEGAGRGIVLDAFSGLDAGEDVHTSTDSIPSFPALHTVHFRNWTWRLDGIGRDMERRFAKRIVMALPVPDLNVQISYSARVWAYGEERMISFDALQKIRRIEGVMDLRVGMDQEQPEPGLLAVVWCETLSCVVWG
ncbi:hypothetical protein FS837_000184 [Tulasnella sp. UAMH 9824]|nr:hypothetical protein FS837_000184 [Tulasnella sp. UAMH 9824]